MIRKLLPSIILGIFALSCVGIAYAEVNPSSTAPTGVDYFQFSLSPSTGSDNTGDGGGAYPGNPAQANLLNYYYVGQQFTTNFLMTTAGASAANIVINYTPTDLSASNIQTGSVFNTWSVPTINPTQVLSTGFNSSGSSSSGTDTNFGSVRWTVLQPTAVFNNYSAPTLVDIEEGIYGNTLNSNISLSGADIMDDEEDGHILLWADITKPYAHLPNPTNGTTGVLVESNYTYQLCDSKDGEAADGGTCISTGVGTGVNTATPPGVLTFNDGTGAVSYTGSNSFACSGIWGTNQCNGTVNPSSPAGIAGDLRNWLYNTLYTVNINSFQDRASSAQSQLGEPSGPNIMNAKTYTFTTEPDTNAPFVQTETPLRASINVGISSNVVIDVVDRKGNRAAPQNVSGTGVVQNSCRFNVTSLNGTLTNLDPTVSPELLVTPPVTIPYGVRYTIDPVFNFAQNETVSISVHSCADAVGNIITTDNYTFTTADLTAPQVTNQSPADNDIVPTNTNIQFDIQDSGVGVDLNSVVIYVNGQYYTRNGGAGQVTSSGTSISFASSLWFDTATNGANYAGDATQVTGTAASYTFTIDPQTNFTDGDIIPIIVYAKDTPNNYMERVVYSVAAGVQLCGNGQTEGYEVCDDGNNIDLDGCSANCISDETCGNGILDGTEQCDDNNTTSGDGCSSSCQFESSGGTTVITYNNVAGGTAGGSSAGGFHTSAPTTSTTSTTSTDGDTEAGGVDEQEASEETTEEIHEAPAIPELTEGTDLNAGRYKYETITEERLRPDDVVSFMLGTEKFEVDIKAITETSVQVSMPNYGEASIPRGESRSFDLNGDGINDLTLDARNINTKIGESLMNIRKVDYLEERLLKRTFEMERIFKGQVDIGDSIHFTVGTQKHTATVLDIKKDTIQFRIESEPQIIDVNLSGEGGVDVNSDGEPDLLIAYSGMDEITRYADITLTRVEKKQEVVEEAIHQAPASQEDMIDREKTEGLLEGVGVLMYEISKIRPLSLVWVILILTILLGALYVRWMQLRNKKILAMSHEERESAKKGQNFMRTLIWIIFGAIIAMAIMEGVLMKENKTLQKVDEAVSEVAPKLMDVSGRIIDPINESGVSDVDLTAGNTTIHTEGHGAFAFYNMDGAITINHPKLLRTVEKKIDGNQADIFYNTDMFNTVIKELNLEARSHGAADTIVTEDDLADQTIVIGSIEKDRDALKIEVINDDLSKIYKLTFDGQEWYLAP